MASYPTAPKTFTTKNAGDTIQPGHINDLQDEVAAIEGGLLNGTAPLNSSNSTVANLVVTGNCTIAGTLTVRPQSYVRAQLSGNSTFGTASSGTKIGFNVRVADLSSEYDSTTFTFTPKSSGYYSITARTAVATAGIGPGLGGLWVNDTLTVYTGVTSSGAGESITVASVLALSSGAAGSVQFRVYATSTGRVYDGVGTSIEILKLF